MNNIQQLISVCDNTSILSLHSVDARLLHDVEELLLVDLSVPVLVELVYHGLKLVVAQVLAEFAGNAPQVAKADFSGVILVEELKGFEDLFNRIAF